MLENLDLSLKDVACGIIAIFLCVLLRYLGKFVSKSFKIKLNAYKKALAQGRLSKYGPELYELQNKFETLIIDENDQHQVDFTKINYLNMLNNQVIKDSASDCIRKYGIGICGPRGAFGEFTNV